MCAEKINKKYPSKYVSSFQRSIHPSLTLSAWVFFASTINHKIHSGFPINKQHIGTRYRLEINSFSVQRDSDIVTIWTGIPQRSAPPGSIGTEDLKSQLFRFNIKAGKD